MKSEKAASALRINVGRLAFRVGVLISEISNFDFSLGLERSEVLRFNGVLDIKGFFCFILSFANEISSESEVDAMNASHDSLHLADGGGLQNGLQVLVERIATAFQSVAGG